jgi:hypothetical protein
MEDHGASHRVHAKERVPLLVWPLGFTTCGMRSVTTLRAGCARARACVSCGQSRRLSGQAEVLTSSNKRSWALALWAVAATVVLALAACGTAAPSSGPTSGSATKAEASCASAYVDWLYRSGSVKCDEAKDVASAIFMGDDGNERTSFMKQDFSGLPTVEVAGVGDLPTRILGSWRCRYSTRRSSYGVQTTRTVRFVYATCRLDTGIVKMTTAIDQRANRKDS